MRRGTIISTLLHLTVLAALIVSFPAPKLPESADTSMDVEIIGTSNAPPNAGKTAGKTPAANKGPKHQAQTADNAPKKQPTETAPPPPPPPQPSVSVPKTSQETPKQPTPPPVQPQLSPDAPKTPLTPPQKVEKTIVKPPPAKKTPPAQHAVTTAPESPTHQQHEVKISDARSPSTKKTLLDMKAIQKQLQAPTHVVNPDQQTDTDPGGDPNSTANTQLSGADKNAIGSRLHPCFHIDTGALNADSLHVLLDITTDPTGTIRVATVDPKDQDNMSNPLFYAYAQRAIAAALDVQCATLPLPKSMLGSNQNLTVEFVGQ